jgi:hypothetical protein
MECSAASENAFCAPEVMTGRQVPTVACVHLVCLNPAVHVAYLRHAVPIQPSLSDR